MRILPQFYFILTAVLCGFLSAISLNMSQSIVTPWYTGTVALYGSMAFGVAAGLCVALAASEGLRRKAGQAAHSLAKLLTPKLNERGRLMNLDLLRIFLAVEVVLSHGTGTGWGILAPVPAFVCLSGYLIPASYVKSRNAAHFAKKRVLRVFPAFALTIAAVALLFGWETTKATLTYYISFGLAATTILSAVPALWSLWLEELLYTSHVIAHLRGLWQPATIWLSMALVYVVWGIMAYFGVAASWFATSGSLGNQGRYGQIWIAVVCYLAGNLAYFYKAQLSRLSTAFCVTAAGLLILAQNTIGHIMPILVGIKPFILPLACVLLLFALMKIPQLKWHFPDSSYGLYVYHGVVLYWMMHVNHIQFSWNLAWIVLAVSTVAATISWYTVEKRALTLK